TIPRMDKLLHRPRIKAAQDPAADKVLTLCLRTCDNITRQIEDSMARQSGRGSSRPRHLIRKIALASRSFSSPRLGILALLLVLASVPLNAQTPDVEDIHIAPRVETDKDKANAENALLNDTVRAHAPLIRSKVDLVLVPVTVTDPMNRLVTGLDR